MKKFIKLLFIFLVGSVLNTHAQNDTIQIQTTAQCGECKMNLERNIGFEKGVKSVKLNMDSKILTVIYNPEKTTPEKLRVAVTKTGYDADDLPADPKAVAKLNPCCTKDGHKDH